ncbi:hypothetical protein [Cellulosimicrobium sp. Marseille-Q4280]|uniref:hypothetical protein n=1 Tax=Cellulosimicrobium sp. Marseille-Q4280 TaxID=2937992 RepID=UPI00203E7F77|nr:hypothetical protein [Cellulosimicrobium sp. Marseille-Q4280]
MSANQQVAQNGFGFAQLLEAAAKLPGVRIDRADYLRKALQRHCTEDQVSRAIAESPAAAGIPLEVIREAADSSIRFETSKVTALSAAAGIPGGWALLGSVPADLAQFMGHLLRVTQKLAYIYSWPDLFENSGEDLDEATESLLTLFIGVMFGVSVAQAGVTKVAEMMAAQAVKKLPQKALTKGIIYPTVKNVAGLLGVAMTKKTFASGVAKAIPVAGALLSGGLTLATFLPMSRRLQRHLASLELTKPGLRAPNEDRGDDELQRDEADEDQPRDLYAPHTS